jgi:hypothetical protein
VLTAHWDQRVARHRGQASPERHSVGVCKIRYVIRVDHRCPPGTPVSAQVRCWNAPAARSAFRLAPPPHIPYDPIDDPTLPAGARGPLFIFRKIHLYGKTKKSTHSHTNDLPTRPEKSFASSKIFDFAPPTRPPTHARPQLHSPMHAHRHRRPPATTKKNALHAAAQRTAPLSRTAAPARDNQNTVHARAAPRRTHAQASAHACTRAERHQRPPATPDTPSARVCSVRCGAERRCSSAAVRRQGAWVVAHHHRTAQRPAYPVSPIQNPAYPVPPHTKSGLPCTTFDFRREIPSHLHAFLGFGRVGAILYGGKRPTLYLPIQKAAYPAPPRTTSSLPCTGQSFSQSRTPAARLGDIWCRVGCISVRCRVVSLQPSRRPRRPQRDRV